tara:strand:+ start:1022 stop:1405 length:384 start_codon:yes stop_codon:yes gene_type:complete
MNIITDIPKTELECFKGNVKEWISIDDQIAELNQQIKELKAKKNKLLEPKITLFMRQYNISDLNTDGGKLRCNERNTKKPLSKSLIKQGLTEFFKQDEEKVETVMEHMVSKQEIVKSYKLLRSTKKL